MTDLDALQTMLLDEFARIHDRLNTIEHKLSLKFESPAHWSLLSAL
jgi:hypothetical protein